MGRGDDQTNVVDNHNVSNFIFGIESPRGVCYYVANWLMKDRQRYNRSVLTHHGLNSQLAEQTSRERDFVH